MAAEILFNADIINEFIKRYRAIRTLIIKRHRFFIDIRCPAGIVDNAGFDDIICAIGTRRQSCYRTEEITAACFIKFCVVPLPANIDLDFFTICGIELFRGRDVNCRLCITGNIVVRIKTGIL